VFVRRAAVLGTLCVPGFMVVLDSNMVTVALPSLRRDLGLSHADLQWVIAAYSLAFGGTLLVAGRAGDLFGRRRLLLAGVAGLALTSIAAAAAPSPELLLGARALQGLAAAMALPASLAILTTLFEAGDARNRALGVYGMALSAAFVSGVAVGGALTALAGWRAVFVVNGPIGVAAAVAVWALVREDNARGRIADLDLPGAVVAVGAGLALLYGLGLAARTRELSVTACALLALSLVLVVVARALEHRARVPLVPPRLLRRGPVAGACIAALLTVGTGVGVMFILTLYLQDVLGYGPAASGLALSGLGAAGVAAGSLAPRVARRTGLPGALAAALLVQAAGVAVLIPIDARHGLGLVLPGTAIVGMGHFGATVAFTALATSTVCERQRGVALGLVSSSQQIGGALGLALLVAVATLGAAGARTDTATVYGFRWALGVGAALSLLAAILVLAVTRETARQPRHGSETTRSRAP
jgi:MFS family permease